LRVLYYLLFVIGLSFPSSFYIINSTANESFIGHLRVAGSQERCPAGTELMLGSPNAATRLTMRDWRTLWRDSCKGVSIDGLTARRWEKHIRLRLHGSLATGCGWERLGCNTDRDLWLANLESLGHNIGLGWSFKLLVYG
jgi:hypothetical protein